MVISYDLLEGTMKRRKAFRGAALPACIALSLALAGCADSGSDPSGGETSLDYVSPNIGTLKYVPAGTFSRSLAADTAEISSVSEFRIGARDITQEQYYAITGYYPSWFTVADGPVEYLSWYDAVNFCNLLSAKEGLSPYYSITGITTATGTSTGRGTSYSTIASATVTVISGDGYRLPTEMEWEWAAMGATSDSYSAWYVIPANKTNINLTGIAKGYAGARSSSVDGIGDYAWDGDNSDGITHAVGTKKPNELGLFDMTGNVLQWCWDWYADSPAGSVTDYAGPSSGTLRIAHGGCTWGRSGNQPWIYYRFLNYSPDTRNNGIGFRVARR
jgi:formylglycine-generating enzyme required for sulfatase activity